MKKRPTDKIKRLVDPSTDQTQVVHFPENWRSAYEAYTMLYSGNLLKPGRERASLKEVVTHTLLIGLWIGVFTTFFWMQRNALHHPADLAGNAKAIQAQLVTPSKGTL